MSEAQTRPDLSLLPVERPRCPKRQNRMNLTRIMPGQRGFEMRNFECAKCDQFKTVTIEADHYAFGESGLGSRRVEAARVTLAHATA